MWSIITGKHIDNKTDLTWLDYLSEVDIWNKVYIQSDIEGIYAEHVFLYTSPPLSDMEKVLRDDREKLRRMQKSQPRFTKDQKRELVEVHPWMKRGGLPKAIDVKVILSDVLYVGPDFHIFHNLSCVSLLFDCSVCVLNRHVSAVKIWRKV